MRAHESAMPAAAHEPKPRISSADFIAGKVPEAAEIRQNDTDRAIATVGNNLWLGFVYYAAAQRLVGNQAREKFAQDHRSPEYRRSFMRDSHELFQGDPESHHLDQFGFGLMTSIAVRKAAISVLLPPGADDRFLELLDFSNVFSDVGSDPNAGYCYLDLFPEADRETARLTLGAWPTSGSICDWFYRRQRIPPNGCRGRLNPHSGRHHVDPDGPDYMVFLGRPVPATGRYTVLRYDDRLGGDDSGNTRPVLGVGRGEAGGTILRLRAVFINDTHFSKPVEDFVGLQPYVSVFGSVQLLRVRVSVATNDPATQAHIGMHPFALGPADANGIYRPGPMDPFLCDEFTRVDVTTTSVGDSGGMLLVPVRCDPELSSVLPAVGGCRPWLVVRFSAAGSSTCTIELELKVSGSGIIAGPGSRVI